MKINLRFVLFLGILLAFRANVWAQCSIPALPSCANCTVLTDNSNKNISSGTYCVTTTVNNLNLSGSAVLCVSGAGQVGGNFNGGGTIIYNGGTVSNPINFGNLGGNGTVRIRSSVALNNLSAINSNATVIVENGATLTVSSIDINGTLIVDQSTLYVNNAFGINGGGHVCFNGGVVNTSQFRSNDQSNSTSVTSTSSKGCYAVRNSFNGFNASLTNTSKVFLCLPGSNVPNNVGSATVSTNCSNGTAGGGCYTALPIRLVSFQAQSVGEGVRLDWSTSMEKDFDYFQVERSTDAIAFESISPRIKSQGSENAIQNYTWMDASAKSGTFYYRLRQVDLDNSYTYSKIVGILFDGEDKGVSLRPNPFSSELNITLNSPMQGKYVIELYSVSGKLQTSVTGEKSESVITQTLATANLPAGVYVARVRLGDQHFVRKVVKP